MKLYNTLTRKKEELQPLVPGKISMYVCGPTVYDYCHLGHAKGYVSMDVIRRYLEWSGFNVKYVQNFTDVGHLTDDADEGEDKIEKRAKRDKVNPLKLVETFINSYYDDFKKLNVKDPDIAPRPSEEIPEIIEFIEQLIEKGYAYESNGSVYFSVEKFDNYGKLSGHKIEDLISGARVSIRTEKKNPLDFAIWIKAEPDHILKWPSPWSVGYPGWHIECSVMSQKYLGDTFDIHGGGIENIFPHNESEIAQSEALTGKPMAHYWILWNMVMIDGNKMSKSTGNFTTIHDLLDKYDPMIIRLAIIKSHYRSRVDFTSKMFDEATDNYLTIKDFVLKLQAVVNDKGQDNDQLLKNTKEAFINAMDDDFNTPKAIAVLFNFIKEMNKFVTQGLSITAAQKALKLVYDLDKVLGLELEDLNSKSVYSIPKENRHTMTITGEKLVDKLFMDYRTFKGMGNYEVSDKIRDIELPNLGYIVEETSESYVLKKL